MSDDFELSRRDALRWVSAASLALGMAPAGAQAPVMDSPGGPRRAYANGRYGQIHYRYVEPATVIGGKPPLLCLHASPLSGIVYDNWLLEMGRDRRAFAPDTPGYGGSDAPPSPPEIADYARTFLGLIDELQLDQVDVMGYHTGSMTAVEMARRDPRRVRKVVMISAPLFTAEELAQLRAAMLTTPTYETLLANDLASWRKNGKGMLRDEPTDERYADIKIESMRRYRTASWGFRAAFNYDLAHALTEVTQPILLLNPEDDLWEMTPRAMKYSKTATLHNLPGWTHGHLDAHTVEMAAIVRAFLDHRV